MTKFIIYNRQRITSFLFCFFIIFPFIIPISGCGSGSSDSIYSESSDSGTSETASASFAVEWHDTSAIESSADTIESSEGNLIPTEIDCGATGVSTVTCQVYDGSNTYLTSGGPWDCYDGSGTIYDIPPGTDRVFVVLGEGAGGILYQGETEDSITLTAGQTTDVGLIDAFDFVPDLISPANGSSVTVNDFSFNWSSIQNAYEYRLQMSEVSDFSTTIINQTTTSTSYTPSDLSASATYYWKVYARDIHANQSAEPEPDNVWSFTTTEPAPCTYSISPPSSEVNPSAATYDFSVTAPTGCSWTASTSDSWITIISGTSGSGNGTVTYSVSANTGTDTDTRTGIITVADQTHTVTQR